MKIQDVRKLKLFLEAGTGESISWRDLTITANITETDHLTELYNHYTRINHKGVYGFWANKCLGSWHFTKFGTLLHPTVEALKQTNKQISNNGVRIKCDPEALDCILRKQLDPNHFLRESYITLSEMHPLLEGQSLRITTNSLSPTGIYFKYSGDNFICFPTAPH